MLTLAKDSKSDRPRLRIVESGSHSAPPTKQKWDSETSVASFLDVEITLPLKLEFSPNTQSTSNIPLEIPDPEFWLKERLKYKVEGIFRDFGRDRFEDGISSPFSRNLVSLIRIYGKIALQEISKKILDKDTNSEPASEALRWIGSNSPKFLKGESLSVLSEALNSPSETVRDGAIVGLGALDDDTAIPLIKRALEREKNAWLKKDLQALLDQFE